MKKKIIIAIVIVAAILAGLAGVKALQIGKLIGGAKTYTVPPETVSSAMVQEQKWQDTLTAVGSISAAQGVTVAAEVAGTVTEIAFESGAVVAKGDGAPSDPADVTFTATPADAHAMHEGTLDLSAGFMRGQVKMA